VQASLIALPAAMPPRALTRLRRAGWAMVPAGSIAIVVGILALLPGTADFFTYLALIATPLAAALALGHVMHGARPPLALIAVPLLAVAWAAKGSLTGEAAALSLTALGCLTLGWLLAAVTPARWLKIGIVVAALIDSYLVFSNLLEQPNATLNAAAPAGGLPQLQFASFGTAAMGYGDYFIAGVLGGLLLLERRRGWPVAIGCLAFAAAWDLLFFTTDTLPATVPVALALIASELAEQRARSRRVLVSS
jgi:hypothetical protein